MMLQSRIFSPQHISRFVRAGDSQRFQIDLKKNKETIISDVSEAILDDSIDFTKFNLSQIKGRPCVSYSDYGTNLLMRVITHQLSKRFRVRFPNRDRMIGNIAEGLMDRTPIYLARYDISSFYESIPRELLYKRLVLDTSISTRIRDYLIKFFKAHQSPDNIGLPRGVSLTAVFSELLMEHFDTKVKGLDSVYRYFRYSDDMLIFSYRKIDNLTSKVANILPTGMALNSDKLFTHDLDTPKTSPISFERFEYLGYSFEVDKRQKRQEPRTVKIGIADKKIRRLKTRVVLSLKDFEKNKDEQLLLDRLRVISSNYKIHRHGISAYRTSKYIKTGIFYNYNKCGILSDGQFSQEVPDELKKLDDFLFGLTTGKHSKFKNILKTYMSPLNHQKLRKISFRKGFESRLLVRVPYKRFSQIQGIWRNAK